MDLALPISSNLSESSKVSDVTFNLASLQFENALNEDEKKLLIVRQRAHALSVFACAQATYFVSILNEARQIQVQLQNPNKNKLSKLLQEGLSRNPLHIGIIGCGRVGSHLANCLLTFGEVQPDDIKISTRRPETLIALQEKGIECMYNNAEVAEFSHLLFICVLPSQVPNVVEEIKDVLQQSTLVYSMASSIPASKVGQLLHHTNVVRPSYMWEVDKVECADFWDYNNDMPVVFSDPKLLEHTCPLYKGPKGAFLSTEEKFAEVLVYAFVNHCTSIGLTTTECARLVNAVILGESEENHLAVTILPENISKTACKEKCFPLFDLTRVIAKETPLTQMLQKNVNISQDFAKRYLEVFNSYVQWMKYSSQQK